MGPSGTVNFGKLVASSQNGMYVDTDFPADDHAVFIEGTRSGFGEIRTIKKVKWVRPNELKATTNAKLFIDDPNEDGDGGAEANDIMQGPLGDCYLLSSLGILCSSPNGLVTKLFIECEYFDQGLVGLKFFKDGMWWDVAVDTFIPTTDNNCPCFARNKNPEEFWMVILEKAYAKMHGSYESLDAGLMSECLVDLTGAAPGEISVKDLFASCPLPHGGFDKAKAMDVLFKRSQGTLLQGASLDGESEAMMQGGLIAGHAYSINGYKKCDFADLDDPYRDAVLVKLRNPWGHGEWTGQWSDNDPIWNTPGLKEYMGQTDKEDGMFWMDIDDFGKSFTTITYVDLVPNNFTVLRADSEWGPTTAGGLDGTWHQNPQLLMRVERLTAQITISLNQPDSRMQFSNIHLNPPLDTNRFWDLYGDHSPDDSLVGYENAMIFMVFAGGQRKKRPTACFKMSALASVRTMSIVMKNVEPGEYVIVPALQEAGVQMKLRMRFWSSEHIELIDTNRGKDWTVYDARDDANNAPMEMPVMKAPVEVATEMEGGGMIVQANALGLKQPGILEDTFHKAAMSSWKVGDYCPKLWSMEKGDYSYGETNQFNQAEICGIMRLDNTVRFAYVEKDNRNGTYDLITGFTKHDDSNHSNDGLTPMYKYSVPSKFICKFPYENYNQGRYPKHLIRQIETSFDLVDSDNNGHLDFHFCEQSGKMEGELGSELATRILSDLDIDVEDKAETIKRMAEMDTNGDGTISKEEFVDFVAERKLEMTISSKHAVHY